MKPANLWEWEGKASGTAYLAAGAIASGLKFLVDWLAVSQIFHRPWSPGNYWRPFGAIQGVRSLSPEDRMFAATLLFLALPFIWLGLAMTVKRLRDSGQPTWLAALFFAPIVNLVFFLVLVVLPSRAGSEREGAPWPEIPFFARAIPRSGPASALFSIGVTTLLGFLFAFVSTEVIAQYGWSLFVGLPFCLGLFAVLTFSYHQPRRLAECLTVAVLPVAMLGALLLFAAMEGIICLLMAAPLAGALSLLGGLLGFAIQAAHWGRRHAQAIFGMAILLSPGFLGVEHLARPEPAVFEVTSAVEIAAPPERVWREVIAFAEIPPPKEAIFRAGIAYPVRAEIAGRGPGAVRRCIFSTGPFVEPIMVWDEPHLLRFRVTEVPAPMRELTPYGHIQPKHLDGYFTSRQGQFLLTALPGGRTRVAGTTWYSHALWPETYWHWWSDYVIHRIHMRVLEQIRARAEGQK